MIDGHPYAICLTHDVDRPYKGLRSLYYALKERPEYHLETLLRRENPYWQFDSIMELEASYGVRSAFYFLSEPHILRLDPSSWLKPTNWVQHLGRYHVDDDQLANVIQRLDDGGWEVGLHGSYHSYRDARRLRREKLRVEDIVRHPVRGGRQHYLKIDCPRTWRMMADLGMSYDSSLGSGKTFGFEFGLRPFRPFADEFVVFPLTMMDQAVMAADTSLEEIWRACEAVLSEAADRRAVVTIDWHQRVFASNDFPGYRSIYERLLERAVKDGAWIGPPGELYDSLPSTQAMSLDNKSAG